MDKLKSIFEINDQFAPVLFKSGKIQIKLSVSNINWICNFDSHNIELKFVFKKRKILEIKGIFSSKLHINNFIDLWTIFFYRLLFIIENNSIDLQALILGNSSNNLELNIRVKSTKEIIINALANRKSVSKIFAKYPEINLDKYIYNWGWIDEGPTNLIYYSADSLIYDFYINYTPIGVVKWKIVDIEEESFFNLQIKFQDIILGEEIDPQTAFNNYRLGWLLFLYKVKDYSEHGKLSLKLDIK